jgi:hypothetical protein
MEKQLSMVQVDDNTNYTTTVGPLPLDKDNSTNSRTPPTLFKSKSAHSSADLTVTTDPSPTNHQSWGSDSLVKETITYTDEGSPSDSISYPHDSENDYETMSDSVRQQAARILANPTTVEQEVRDTISQLRVRYQQLQEKIQQQHQHKQLQHQKEQQHQRESTANDLNHGSNEYHLNIAHRRPLYNGAEMEDQVTQKNTKPRQPNTNNPSSLSSAATTTPSGTQGVLYVQHNDDELIALHVLQGLQKQQLQI